MVSPQAEWSIGKDPDILIDIWSTSALIEAVLEALLEEPEKLELALRALRPANPA
ncbi:MAG TPA: hypothetical protein VEO20_05405 [Thermoplasmata archaeon]|nr:hypothetical protein [Thermoplasmata archaeon]